MAVVAKLIANGVFRTALRTGRFLLGDEKHGHSSDRGAELTEAVTDYPAALYVASFVTRSEPTDVTIIGGLAGLLIICAETPKVSVMTALHRCAGARRAR